MAVAAGWLVGSAANMGTIMLGSSLVPPPDGVDVMNPESIAANLDRFEMVHFIVPFLAHALGALIGGYVAAKLALVNRMRYGLIVGGIFLLGGIAMSQMVPAPTWFTATDLLLAYIPMAFIGARMAGPDVLMDNG